MVDLTAIPSLIGEEQPLMSCLKIAVAVAFFGAAAFITASQTNAQVKECGIMRVSSPCEVIENANTVTITIHDIHEQTDSVPVTNKTYTYHFKQKANGYFYDNEGYLWKKRKSGYSTIYSGGEGCCTRPGLCKGTAIENFD